MVDAEGRGRSIQPPGVCRLVLSVVRRGCREQLATHICRQPRSATGQYVSQRDEVGQRRGLHAVLRGQNRRAQASGRQIDEVAHIARMRTRMHAETVNQEQPIAPGDRESAAIAVTARARGSAMRRPMRQDSSGSCLGQTLRPATAAGSAKATRQTSAYRSQQTAQAPKTHMRWRSQ
jgi:hypothetical protein